MADPACVAATHVLCPRWKVELTGHEFDLEDLSATWSGSIRVLKEDGRFLLEADEFENLGDAMEVRFAAEKLMTGVNGAMRLGDPSRKNAHIGHVHEITSEGGRTTHVILVGSIEARSRVSAAVTVIGGDPAPAPAKPPAVAWAELGSRDTDVAEVMDIWANREHDWVNLYKVYEIIKKRGGVPESKAKRDWQVQAHGQSSGSRGSGCSSRPAPGRPSKESDAARRSRRSRGSFAQGLAELLDLTTPAR